MNWGNLLVLWLSSMIFTIFIVVPLIEMFNPSDLWIIMVGLLIGSLFGILGRKWVIK